MFNVLLEEYVINHPVHILNKDKQISPSALIPFCEFGGNMRLLGVRNNNFTFPVCSAFRKRIVHGELCYQVNINNFKKSFKVSELNRGLSFLLDYNEDRQISQQVADNVHHQRHHHNMVDKFVDLNDHHKAAIHLDTISGDQSLKLKPVEITIVTRSK